MLRSLTLRKIKIPTYHAHSIFDLKSSSLIKKGIKLILTDLDNTLDHYRQPIPSDKVINKIEEFKKNGLEIIIISNNFKDRVDIYARHLKIENRHLMLKPFGWKIKKLIKEKGYDKNQVVVIGDQIYTDVMAGNRAKVMTILVDPLTNIDQPYTRFKRKFEKPLLAKMKNKNLIKEWED